MKKIFVNIMTGLLLLNCLCIVPKNDYNTFIDHIHDIEFYELNIIEDI